MDAESKTTNTVTGTSWELLDALAGQHGDAFYVARPDIVRSRVEELRSAFTQRLGAVTIAYPYKANHTPALCRLLHGLGVGAEVGSAKELWLSRELGVPGRDIILNGVNRDESTLATALAAGVLVFVDIDRDVAAIRRLAPGTPGRVGIRINIPTAAIPTPRLGMEANDAIVLIRKLADDGVGVVGLHAHTVDISVDATRELTRVLVHVAVKAGLAPGCLIDVGGGLILKRGGSLPCAREAFSAHADAVACELESAGLLGQIGIIIEPGNSLVADAFSLCARVLDVRCQHGRRVVTVAASILDSSPNTRRVDFPAAVIPRAASAWGGDCHIPVYVAGSTLIDGDWLHLNLEDSVVPGDFVVIDRVGAYSVSMASSFMSAPLAIVCLEGDNCSVWRRRISFRESFEGFIM